MNSSGPIEWKASLDEFLSNIPDCPTTNDLQSGRCDRFSSKPTNSIQDWIPFLGLTGRRGKKDNSHRLYSVDEQLHGNSSGSEPVQVHGHIVNNL